MRILYIAYAKSNEDLATLDIYTPIKELIKRGNIIHLVSMNDGTSSYKVRGKRGGTLKVYPILPPISLSILSVLTLYFSSFHLMLKIHKIIQKTDPYLLISSGCYSLPIISFILSKMNKLKLIIIHRETNLESIYFVSRHNIIIRFFAAILMKLNHIIYKKVQYSLAISKSIELFLRNLLDLKNIITINLLCFDLNDVITLQKDRSKFAFNSEDIIILYSGSVDPVRRIDILIDAFSEIVKKYNTTRLVITGKTPYAYVISDYLKKIKEMDLLERIRFLGFLPRKDILTLMKIADIFVDPYPRKVWTPSGKIIEYMAFGKCIITTDVFSHRYFIQDGINGLLFKPNNERDLITKLDLALSNECLRKHLGQNARKTAEKLFDVKKVISEFEKFCVSVIGHR